MMMNLKRYQGSKMPCKDKISIESWEHDFLKEVVVLVRKEFYRVGTSTDSEKLIEDLLSREASHEADSNDS